jgi:hypothetical protein
MTKSRLGTVVLLALGAVLVLSSCGGGGSKRLTKKQYAAKADTLCAAFNQQVKAAGSPKTVAAIAAAYDKLLSLDRKLVADLKKLKPPANEEKAAARAMTLSDEQATRAAAVVAALKKNDITKASALVKEGNANSSERKTIFKQLGITACANS